MHRSGTSALTRILNFMGASLPRHVFGAADGNETGHWESERLVRLHDALFAQLGATWHDWRPIDLTRLSPADRAQAEANLGTVFSDDFGDSPLFVAKDPRLCRVPELAMSALSRMGVQVAPIIPLRNPLEVMGSLIARKTYWPEGLTRIDAALLWLAHVLDAERATRGRPRYLLTLDDLHDNWRAAVDGMADAFGIAFPVSAGEAAPLVADFLSGALRRQTSPASAVAVDPDTRGWVSDAYDALRVLKHTPDSAHALAQLDRVRTAFAESWPSLERARACAFETVRGQTDVRIEAAERSAVQARAEADGLRTRLGDLALAEQRAATAIGEAAALSSEAAQMRSAAAQAEDAAARERTRAAAAVARAELSAGEARELARLLSEEQSASRVLRSSAAQTAEKLTQTSDELAKTSGELADARADLSQTREELASTQAQLASVEAELSQTRSALSRSDAALAAVRRNLDAERENLEHARDALTRALAHVADLEMHHDIAQRRIGVLGEDLQGVRAALDAAYRQISDIEHDFRSSTSWRLTAPLRALSGGPGKLARMAAAAPRAIALGGGVFRTGAAALRVLAREGPHGLRLRYAKVRAAIAAGQHAAALPAGPVIDVIAEPAALPAPGAQKSGPGQALAPAFGSAWETIYRNALHTARGERGAFHAPKRQNPPRKAGSDVKVVAFYLPQFHLFPENEAWWGAGFNEWTNVTKAQPVYLGHEQPKLPADLGFYDLTAPGVMTRQAAMAKSYGLDGFCFHFYWFGGKRLMEQPLLNWLNDPKIDFPFMLCWANENWTRRWDGADHDVLIAQQHSPEDDEAFLRHLAQYMRDPRYIRVDGKPVLIVYRPSILPDAWATLERWRRLAEGELGLGGLHLVATTSFGFKDYAELGFDALVEFPPHGESTQVLNDSRQILADGFKGIIYSYPELVARSRAAADPDGRVYPTAFPAWDNTARKPLEGHIFADASPALFRDWLAACFARARRTLPEPERFVFVNAWNEWAEGAILEPDRRYGHANLWAVADVVEENAPRDAALERLAEAANAVAKASGPHVAVLHAYYPDVARELAADLAASGLRDVILTVPDAIDANALSDLIAAFDAPHVVLTPNRGRDMAPFLAALAYIEARFPDRWDWVLKLHTKRSPHRQDGAAWRRKLVRGLMPGGEPDAISAALADPKAGIVCGASALMAASGDAMEWNRPHTDALAARLGLEPLGERDLFVAGSMFWARRSALAPLVALGLGPHDFDPEVGQLDATLAHAMERIIAPLAARRGFAVVSVPD